MKLARTVAGAVLAAAAVGGATTGLLLLGTAGATSGRRAEVDAPPAAADCGTPIVALSDALRLPASDIRLRLRAGETLAQMAADQGVDRQVVVVDALTAVGQARIDRGVRTGRLTDEQAAGRTAMLPARVAAAVDNPMTRDRAEGRQAWRRRHGAAGAQVAAALGVSPLDLRQARAAGQSLAEVAEEHGVDPQQVIDELVARSKERITAMLNDDGRPGDCA
jgi:hypothetical protein